MYQLGFNNIILRACLMLVGIPTVYIVTSTNSGTIPNPAVQTFHHAQSGEPANKTVTQEKDGPANEENYFIPGEAVYANRFGYSEAERLAKEGVFIGSKSYDNFIDLENGNILLSPETDIVVGIDTRKIRIKSNATVFIMKSEKDVVIYDLHQIKPNQVYVVIDKHTLVMEPGRMIVLTDQTSDDFEKLNVNCHKVTYRNVRRVALANNEERVFIADFSLTSALVTIEPLKRLVISSNRQDQLALQKIIKDAILLQEFASKADQNL